MQRSLFHRLARPGNDSGKSYKELCKEALRQDLQMLLSTRFTPADSSERNIVNFGIPSVVGFVNDSMPDKAVLAGHIRDAIESFEPRLRNVSVEFLGEDDLYRDECKVVATTEHNDQEERFSFQQSLS